MLELQPAQKKDRNPTLSIAALDKQPVVFGSKRPLGSGVTAENASVPGPAGTLEFVRLNEGLGHSTIAPEAFGRQMQAACHGSHCDA